jgi:hypothetical protein
MKPVHLLSMAARWIAMACLMPLGVAGVFAAEVTDASNSALTAASTNLASTNLVTRAFKVDTNTFLEGLESGEAGSGNFGRKGGVSQEMLHDSIRVFFNSLGVDLNTPKSASLDLSKGMLIVRATPADLEIVGQAVAVLNTPPPNVTLQLRCYELPDNAVTSGFLASIAARTNLEGRFFGTLTEPQRRGALSGLEQREGVTNLCEREVRTLSGREVKASLAAMGTNSPSAIPTATNSPTITITPYVSADGFTIQLILSPDFPQAMAYQDTIVRPPYSVIDRPWVWREDRTTAVLWDGQTQILGRLILKERLGVANSREKRLLLLFVTPTIVDSAGKRIRSEAELRFSETNLPWQPPAR